jgi:hypothetical protein
MGLPWLDDEHASLQFGSTRVFTLMDGTSMETQLEERRLECLLMSSTKVQKLMRKTRRTRGCNAEFYVIELTPTATQSTEFHTGEELTTYQRDNFRLLLYDDFPELLQLVNSPLVSRQWDHPIETTSLMKRQRLNRLSPAERSELNRQLKNAVDAGLIRSSYSELGSPILHYDGEVPSDREIRRKSQLLFEDAQLKLLIVNALQLNHEFADLIREGYSQDSFYGDEGEWTKDSRIEAIDGYFWRLDSLCIPRNSELRLRLISELHASSSAGHRGVASTLAKALDRFWWKRLRQDVKDLYERCVVCRRAKIRPQMAATLYPLPVPPRPWHIIGLAYLTHLHESNGFNSVLIIVDHLTRMAHFLPCT